MYCQECQKRPATVHITKIVNGNKIEKHLCEQCAQKQQEQIGLTFMPSFSIANFLSSMLEIDPFTPLENVSLKPYVCDKCGMNYSEFTKTGRLGCNKCYEYFGERIENLVKRIHGNTQHIGKIPNRAGEDIRLNKELYNAKLELQKAVMREEFELAAKLRDKIKELEKRKRKKGMGIND